MSRERSLENFNSVIELLQHFDSEEKCAQYLAAKRWGSRKADCVRCGHGRVYELRGKTKRYKCAKCREQFSVRTGTIFDSSPLKLQTWFVAIYLVTAHKKGISSAQLARDLNVTQKTAWFMLQRIRYSMGQEPEEQMDGEVEMDETFVGGKAKNMHFRKRLKKGAMDKTPVFGMLQRGGKVAAFAVPKVELRFIMPIIGGLVAKGATVFTDELSMYKSLGKDYQHHVINHRLYQYVNGPAHTNSIEGFWAYLKRALIGIYHWVSPRHLQMYVNEAVFRYNNRHVHDCTRFGIMLGQVFGHLTYKRLVHG